jgi:hypothetical protein
MGFSDTFPNKGGKPGWFGVELARAQSALYAYASTLTAVLDGSADADDVRRLDSLLAENPAAMNAYVALMQVDAMLRWRSGLGAARDDRQAAAPPKAKKGTGPICRNGPDGAAHKLDLSPFSPSSPVGLGRGD